MSFNVVAFYSSLVASLEKKGKIRKPWACPVAWQDLVSEGASNFAHVFPSWSLLVPEGARFLTLWSPEHVPRSARLHTHVQCFWSGVPQLPLKSPPSLPSTQSPRSVFNGPFLTPKQICPLSLPSDTFHLLLSC